MILFVFQEMQLKEGCERDRMAVEDDLSQVRATSVHVPLQLKLVCGCDRRRWS